LALDQSNQEVINELLFTDEAWKNLSNPVLRKIYDEKLAGKRASDVNDETFANETFTDNNQSVFLAWWEGGKVSKVLVGVAVFLAILFIYNYQSEKQRVRLENQRIELEALKEARAAENEAQRIAIETARLQNQRILADRQQSQQQQVIEQHGRVMDRSLDISNRREDRGDRELGYRAAATAAELDMRRQSQQWRQEQYEKDQAERDARNVHLRERRRLCDIYRGNNQPLMARQEGCY
jgi:hypothetical protein